MGLPVVVCPGSALHDWFSHSGSPQMKSSAVRASASGAVAGTSAGTGTRTVVRTAAAVAVVGMSTGPAVKTSAREAQMWFVHDGKKRRDRAWNRSSRLRRRHVLPVAMSHACTTALYLVHLPPCCWSPYDKLWYSRTPCVLLLLCCSGTSTRFFGRGTLSPAVKTSRCHTGDEALPQGVWYTPYPG